MTSYWTRCDTLLPSTNKKILVYIPRYGECRICELIVEDLKPYWEGEGGFSTELDSEDMWCDIPYPESTEVCVYDNKEVYDNCTVEIWSNENNMSIGWWKNEGDN